MTSAEGALFGTALAELGDVTARIDPADLAAACETIATARNIVLYGCGREGLQMRGFAMRLHHLGCRVAMQGDMACPPVGRGDLFLVSAGPGELSTVTALMRVAREAGAGVLLLTAEPDTPSAALATRVLTIPADGIGLRGRAVPPVRDHGAALARHPGRHARGDARPAHQPGVIPCASR